MVTPLRRSGMARILKGSHSFTCTPRIHPLTEWTIPAFAFPAEAGTHYRPRRDGRLSWPWVAGWLHTEINIRHQELNLDTVTHLSTNRARRRWTSLIETNAKSLILTPVMCGLQRNPLADADLQNFLDLRIDSGSTVHEQLQTWSDVDPVPSVSLARISFLIAAKRR